MNQLSHLDYLESEAVFILREIVAQAKKPVLLFSGGKDSAVLAHLALKAFRPSCFSFPVLHIDTGHNFPEVLSFRDKFMHDIDERLIVRSVDDLIKNNSVTLDDPNQSRNSLQSICLLNAITEFGFGACIGGARRDEEKARAKERIFSYRDKFGRWNPKNQRPELWNLYNGFVKPGEHLRVFPLSNWTELDIWNYIQQEKIQLPSLYFAHLRPVTRRNGLYVPISDLLPLKPNEVTETLSVRFRTVGDMSCTCPVLSDATNITDIINEIKVEKFSERGASRLDDQAHSAAMEERKMQGYF